MHDTDVTPLTPPAPAPSPGMRWVPAGTFLMGSDAHYPEEAPAHKVTVDGFWIDCRPVTNEAFAKFVEETGHTTVAESPPDPAEYPSALPEPSNRLTLTLKKAGGFCIR